MEEFVVYSPDLDLQRAFVAKLEQKGYKKNPSDPHWRSCILIERGNEYYGLMSYELIFDSKVYTLPQQWDEAIQALEEIEKSHFKIGDWVVDDLGTTLKISDIEPNKIWFDKKTWHFPKSIKRNATKEEIKQELIRRSGLKIGDTVIVIPNEYFKFKIEDFVLVDSTNLQLSDYCEKYYEDGGLHLAVRGEGFVLPVAKVVRKMEEYEFLSFKTNRGEYKPHKVYDSVVIGCLELKLEELETIVKFLELLKNKKMDVGADQFGDIKRVNFEGEKTTETISFVQVKTLVKWIKKGWIE